MLILLAFGAAFVFICNAVSAPEEIARARERQRPYERVALALTVATWLAIALMH